MDLAAIAASALFLVSLAMFSIGFMMGKKSSENHAQDVERYRRS